MKHWTKIEKIRRRFINMFYRKLRLALNELINPVLEYLEYASDLDALKHSIPSMIKTDRVNEVLIELYGKVGGYFGRNVKDSIRGRQKDVELDLWEERMEQYAIFQAGEQIVSINEYTKKEFLKLIQNHIDEGTKKGLGINQIAANMRKTLPREWKRGSTWKARRIAQTEVLTASNTASFEAAGQTGYVMKKIWLTAPPGIAKTERHAAIPGLNEQKRGMDEPFDVGGVPMMHPGDPAGRAENVINCRCTLVYEIV